MQQLFLELEKDKICSEPKEKAKEKLCVGDEIKIISLRGKTKKALSYSGRKLIHRKGKVIQVLGIERNPNQGILVKFGKKGFEYAFYPNEVKKIKQIKKRKNKKIALGAGVLLYLPRPPEGIVNGKKSRQSKRESL